MTGRITAADIETAFPYTSSEITEAINELPRTYSKINAMGVFKRENINSTIVRLTVNNGEIVILPVRERGAPATRGQEDGSKNLFVECAHIPHMDTIGPDDVQNYLDIIAGGSQRRTVEGEVNKKLQRHRVKHDLTLEFMEMNTIKGVWRDGEGETVMDWFEFFGVTQKTIFFNLGSSTTDLVDKTDELSNHIYDNLKDDVSDGVVVLVSREFFNSLVQHPKYEKYFDKTDAMNRLANMPYSVQGGARGRRTVFQGAIFEEYNGSVARWDKTNGVRNTERMIAANLGHAIPLGTMDTFCTYFGSPYSVAAANEDGQDIYVTRHDLPHEEGVELKSQSNPLVICRRPQVLVKVSSAAS
ncbi:major capsid protein [Phenylobacterium sp.]|uniref:major capsid protein n=1 Tax=Phenylobacterium sp. TaxID=1871053 RepID=UPI004035CB08